MKTNKCSVEEANVLARKELAGDIKNNHEVEQQPLLDELAKIEAQLAILGSASKASLPNPALGTVKVNMPLVPVFSAAASAVAPVRQVVVTLPKASESQNNVSSAAAAPSTSVATKASEDDDIPVVFHMGPKRSNS